jgi:hypothetical protein
MVAVSPRMKLMIRYVKPPLSSQIRRDLNIRLSSVVVLTWLTGKPFTGTIKQDILLPIAYVSPAYSSLV